MSTIATKSMSGIWKSAAVSLVIGSAILLSACSVPTPAKPAAQTSSAKPAAAAVSASKTTTETKTTGQTQTAPKTNSATAAKPASAAQSATETKPMIMVHEDAKLGKILVDAKGMTLYIYDKDTTDKSNCNADCLSKWPLVSASDAKEVIAAGEGVTAKLGVIKRDDGKFQITADGMPLYYYVNDKAAGDVTGQAVGKVWWAVGANGKKIGS